MSFDALSRNKAPSPFGSTIFVGIRLAEPLLQHAILSRNLGSSLIRRFGGHVLPLGTSVHGLTPYRLILFLMSAGCSFKQIFWLTTVAEQEMPVPVALTIGTFNFILNGINSLLFINTFTSPATYTGQDLDDPGFPPTPLLIGSTVYLTGLFLELVSELQRKRFKKDPKNKGKHYSGGLFHLARHINYTGHIFMRGGYALAAGGWIWGGIITAMFSYDFVTRGIPVLDNYCQNRQPLTFFSMTDIPQTDVSRPSALPTAKISRGNAPASIDQSSSEYLDSIEEEWNKRVDMEVETLVDGMVDLVSLASIGDKDKFRIAQESFQAQSRAESMVRAANSLLSITHSMKLLLLLSDEAQLAHRRDAELKIVQEEKNEARQNVAKLLDDILHPASTSK
ncbi:hypothetical protein H0H93_000185 [Arthromyces matolae]|nr:hypothetical protein H0H93_000185 [Arthromyces matolae]